MAKETTDSKLKIKKPEIRNRLTCLYYLLLRDGSDIRYSNSGLRQIAKKLAGFSMNKIADFNRRSVKIAKIWQRENHKIIGGYCGKGKSNHQIKSSSG